MSYQHICDKMDDYLEEFLFTKSKLTQIHYTSDLKHFRKWLKQSNIPEVVTHIRFLDVQRYLKTLPESSSTRRRIIALKSFFHYLHLNDYITKDILKCLKVPVAVPGREETDTRRSTRNPEKGERKNEIVGMLPLLSGPPCFRSTKTEKEGCQAWDTFDFLRHGKRQ